MADAFDLLREPLRSLARERLGRPTPPQERAIPLILRGRDVLLVAPTGTGKTEAAMLPILHRTLSLERRGITSVYVTPLRSLNRDVLDRLRWWCSRLDLRLAVRHGDTSKADRRLQALSPPDLLITTPETLQLLLAGKRLREHLRGLAHVVVDEVHELADDKRGSQLAVTLERLKAASERRVQVVGLSATIGSPERVAEFLGGSSGPAEVVYVPVAKGISVSIEYPRPGPGDPELAERLFIPPDAAARLRRIRELIEGSRSVLVFTNTRPMSEVLGSRLRMWDVSLPVKVHHGSLSRSARVGAESGLKGGGVKAVVCTSSMELGIDVGRVDLVIQYNSPRQAAKLIQRVGRAGHRLGEVSKGVVIVQSPDDALESIVIARRALSEEIEPVRIPRKPLDVLANVVCALLVEKRDRTLRDILDLVRRAWPFSDLGEDELKGVVEFLSSLSDPPVRLIGDVVLRGGPRLFEYYYENLSMIPEVRQYLVVDVDEGAPVGILDEPFVAERGDPGTRFIMSGEVWEIVQVLGDRVYVRRSPDEEGAVPFWEGEEIPVPFEVGQEVGAVRGEVARAAAGGRSADEVARGLAERYPAEVPVILEAIRPTFEHASRGFPTPTDSSILVERTRDTTVVHVHGGTLANRALSMYLAAELAGGTGAPVEVDEDPYRIYLRGPADPEAVVDLLLRPRGDPRSSMRRAAEESGFYRYRVAQAARKMGVVSKDASLTPAALRQVAEAVRGTPVHEQAIRDVLERDMDLDAAAGVIARTSSGSWEVHSLGVIAAPTPLAAEGLRWARLRLERVPPPRRRLLEAAKLRVELMTREVTLACSSCGDYVEEVEVRELPRRPFCPVCGSGELGVLDLPAHRVEVILRSGRGGKEARRVVRRLRSTARLVNRWGRAAIIALAAGLGLKAAEEALKRSGGDEEALLSLILDARRDAAARRFLGRGGPPEHHPHEEG